MRNTAMALPIIAAVLLTTGTLAQEARPVRGVVVAAATETPVANAQVRYEEDGQVLYSTRTDGSGRFEMPPGRRGVVTITGESFATAHRGWPARGSAELLVALVPPAAVQGTVVDAVTGRPVDGAVTVLVRHPSNFLSSTTATEGGTFRIEDLPHGPAFVVVHADHFAPHVGEIRVAFGGVHDIHVGLLLQGAAAGRVVYGSEPVPGALIRVTYSEQLTGSGFLEGLVVGETVTGPDGAFELEGLVPDTPIWLHAELDGWVSDAVTITTRPGFLESGVVLQMP